MTTLKIEHAILDFETWKRAFERDPIGRAASGVRRYRVYRPVDDPKYVILDLDFDGPGEAASFRGKLEEVWRRAELSPGLERGAGSLGNAPRARILDVVEAHTYDPTTD